MSSLFRETLEASRQKLRLCGGSLASYFASSASNSWESIFFVGAEFGDEYQNLEVDAETNMVLPWGEFKLEIDDLQAAPSDTLFLLDLKLTAEEAGGLWASLQGFTHLTFLAVTEVIVENSRRSDVIQGLLGAVSVLDLETLALFTPSASNGVDGAEAFAAALLSSESFPPSHRLQQLFLVVVNNMGIGELDCMSAVANAVQECSIPSLGIHNFAASVQDGQFLESEPFLNMLDTNKSLAALRVSRFRMTDQQLVELLKRLEALASLEVLDLSKCEGFTASRKVVGTVVDFLSARGQRVRELNLSHTPLEDNPAIEAQLTRNRATYDRRLQARQKRPGRAARLFVCGDPFAGFLRLSL